MITEHVTALQALRCTILREILVSAFCNFYKVPYCEHLRYGAIINDHFNANLLPRMHVRKTRQYLMQIGSY